MRSMRLWSGIACNRLRAIGPARNHRQNTMEKQARAHAFAAGQLETKIVCAGVNFAHKAAAAL